MGCFTATYENKKFKHGTFHLSTLAPYLTELSKVFQTGYLNFAQMKASVELCINKLSDTDAKPELKWCVTRFFNPFKIQPDRITKQLEENAKRLNFDGTEFPVNLTYINEFEKENPEISVNVLGYENKNIFPLRISELLEREHEVNLLLLENKHCVLINDLSRLLSSQISGHDGKKFFCLSCFNPFTTKEVLDKHRKYCNKNDSVKITMPETDTILQFENHKHSMRVLTAVYTNFESFTKPYKLVKITQNKSYTKQYQHHSSSGFCYYIVCNGKKMKPILYTKQTADENIGEIFVKRVQKKHWMSLVV